MKQLVSALGKTATHKSPRGSGDPNIKAAEAKLRRRLGTRISISPSSSRPGGKIEIEYYNERDLDRFYGLLMAGAAVDE